MDSYQKFLDNHAADLPQTGFDYQFYCFIYFLFDSEQQDVVSYETEDDIVINRNQEKELIQVKHSVEKDSKLTNLDKDLWKTIYNWIEQWKEYEKNNPDSFIKKHRLTLITNKVIKCEFITKHKDYQNHDFTENDIRDYLTSLNSETEDVQKGIDSLKSLDNADLKLFLLHFTARSIPDALGLLFSRLKRIYPTDKKTNKVLNQIIGKLHKDKYNNATKRYKLKYKRYDFEKEYITILQGERPDLPDFATDFNISPDIPVDYKSMNLFKQLNLINEVDLHDPNDENIPRNYAFYFHYQRNIDKFINNMLIDDTYIKKLEDKAYQDWDRIFQDKKRVILRFKGKEDDKESFIIDKGSECFSEVMKKHIEPFDYNFSNGCFLKLSNEEPPRVGWHNNWGKKYNII